MAINISLYQITDNEKAYPKTIPATPTATHAITLKDGCSIDRPTVSFSGGSAIMATLNYAYIDAFGRYYFIRDRNMLVNGVCELTLESDPLQSFKNYIDNVSATITRSSEFFNGFLLDAGYELLAYKHCAIRNFPVGIDNDDMILTTVG